MEKYNIHEIGFDEDTIEKLQIYREYLGSFLPVFIERPGSIKQIQVFDFFAGAGEDIDGNPGSPLIATCEIKKALGLPTRHKKPPVRLVLNDSDSKKIKDLKGCIDETQSSQDGLTIVTSCKPFRDSFQEQVPTMDGNANLVFLDQYGVKEIGKDVFQKLVLINKTDILFFISSSTANRFKQDPNIRQCLPLTDEEYIVMNGTNCHRILSKAYERWVPDGVEYYLSSFSFRKRANVYGLVFGSHHPLGMDKFLRIAWNRGGDANFDIDLDQQYRENPLLFPELAKPQKIALFEEELKREILLGNIVSDYEVFLYCLKNGFLGSHGKVVLTNLAEQGIIQRHRFSVSISGWKNKVMNRIIVERE